MTSDGSWSSRLRKIGDLERPDHAFLREDDDCYFFGDYTPRAGFNHSETNQLIINLKKHPRHRGTNSWRYKTNAIQRAATAIAGGLNRNAVQEIVIVPIPPSKPPDHAEYDDRMMRVAERAQPFRSAPILSTLEAREPAHHQDGGRSVEGVYASLVTHPERCIEGSICVLIDDVLTTGSSFKACKRKMQELECFNTIIGIFIARCVWPQANFDFVGLVDL